MNKFKLFSFVILAFFASKSYSQIKFGPEIGIGVSNISQNFKNSDLEEETKMKFGYQIGLFAAYQLSDNADLECGLRWSAKGYSRDIEETLNKTVGKIPGTKISDVKGYDRTGYNYLEIPLGFRYSLESGLSFNAGGYFAMGMSGKEKWDYSYTTTVLGFSVNSEDDGDKEINLISGELSKEDFIDDKEDMRRFDYGLVFGVGYKLGPVMLNANYSLGLANLAVKEVEGFSSYDPADYSAKNYSISISAKYILGGE